MTDMYLRQVAPEEITDKITFTDDIQLLNGDWQCEAVSNVDASRFKGVDKNILQAKAIAKAKAVKHISMLKALAKKGDLSIATPVPDADMEVVENDAYKH